MRSKITAMACTTVLAFLTVAHTTPTSVLAAKDLMGDVNHDGLVDACDASYVLEYYSTVSTGGEWDRRMPYDLADVNRDGLVDACDASAILAYYSELSVGTATPLWPFEESITEAFPKYTGIDWNLFLNEHCYFELLSEPRYNADVVVELKGPTMMLILGKKGNWYYVQTDDWKYVDNNGRAIRAYIYISDSDKEKYFEQTVILF